MASRAKQAVRDVKNVKSVRDRVVDKVSDGAVPKATFDVAKEAALPKAVKKGRSKAKDYARRNVNKGNKTLLTRGRSVNENRKTILGA